MEKNEKTLEQKFKKEDHREINKKLKLFQFSNDVGSSLPIWLKNGTLIKNLIKKYLYELEKEYDYTFVTTPILGNRKMYEKSGHLQHYQEFMFPAMEINKQNLMLRPMTCPHHCILFRDQNYSYYDLPVRLSENSLLFRYERSGAIHGLERVRQMELKDTHIFLPQDMKVIKKEIASCFQIIKTALNKLDLQIDKIYLSTHDPKNKEKYFDDPKLWQKTENILEKTLEEMNVKFEKKAGEAAFYGPKIDFQVKSILHHDVTISTIQLDFGLGKKFNLKYRTPKQKKGDTLATPIIVHLGTIGTYERLLALMIEQNKGWLPFWLSPWQIMLFVTNQNEMNKKYAEKIKLYLDRYNLRIKVMNPKKTLSENVKSAWENKIPVQIFIGDKERKDKTITFLHYKKPKEKQNSDIYQLIHHCNQWK